MTFTVPDEVAGRFEADANACGVRIEDAVVEALTEWADRHLAGAAELPELSFIGIGAGRPELTEHHDDALEAFIGCAASGRHDPFDIGAEHPRDMADADVTALVKRLDEAVDRGDARVIDDDVLVELRAAAAAQRAAEHRLESAVRAGRVAGLSWGMIGAQLGMTRPGARQRFERLTET